MPTVLYRIPLCFDRWPQPLRNATPNVSLTGLARSGSQKYTHTLSSQRYLFSTAHPVSSFPISNVRSILSRAIPLEPSVRCSVLPCPLVALALKKRGSRHHWPRNQPGVAAETSRFGTLAHSKASAQVRICDRVVLGDRGMEQDSIEVLRVTTRSIGEVSSRSYTNPPWSA
jgi:hypothetical protein